MKPVLEQLHNPFVNPGHKPEWAQLTRLAGDRAAILFEELRRRLGTIEGLREDLHFFGPGTGWAPRYRVGEKALFTAHIFPGRLEVAMDIEGPLREKLLAAHAVAVRIKRALGSASGSGASIRVALSNRADARSFARLVRWKSKFQESAEREARS